MKDEMKFLNDNHACDFLKPPKDIKTWEKQVNVLSETQKQQPSLQYKVRLVVKSLWQ